MVIAAGDNDWESRLIAAFKQRKEFEVRELDKLDLTQSELFKTVADWAIRWDYTPRMIGLTTIKFRPAELPPDPATWNMPNPDPGQTKRPEA